MATKKATEQQDMLTQKEYKGRQLLQMDKYNNRIARIVLNPDKSYSFADADELITQYLKRKG